MKLSVIIVTFNQFEYLKAAVDSLKKNPPPFAHEIIVVDNNSETDVREFLNDYYHDIRVIRNPVNRGFGWANNRGVAAASGEYLLLLNSDAEVIGNAVEAMVARMDRSPQIGALGPMMLASDGSFQLSYGRRLSLLAEFHQRNIAPWFEKWKCSLRRGEGFLKKTGWVSGACLLTRKGLFAAEPPFDENMFLYFEDHDLCLRVWAMGKQVAYFGGARVRHHGGRSVAALASTMVEYRKSQLYLYQKLGKRLQLFLLKKYLQWKYTARLKKASRADSPASRQEAKVCSDILKLL